MLLMGLAPLVLSADDADIMVNGVAVLLVLPYVLFSPLVGWINDRYSKMKVVQASLVLQWVVMVTLLSALLMASIPMVLVAFFLLGFQSCLMSPGKRGLGAELVGEKRVGEVMGLLEMLVVGCILAGSLAGGFLLKTIIGWEPNPWAASAWSISLLLIGCVVAWLVFLPVPSRPGASGVPFRWGFLWGHARQMRDLYQHPVVFRSALGEAFFYFLGGVMVLLLARVGRDLFPGQAEAIWLTATLTASLGIGVVVGAFIAARICRNGVQTGLIPLGAFGQAATLAVLAWMPWPNMLLYPVMVTCGFFGAWFLVPLSALVVTHSPEDRRGELLAGVNLLSSFAGVLAVGAHALMVRVLHLSAAMELWVMTVLVLMVGIFLMRLVPDGVLRLFGQAVAALHYRVRVVGSEHVPATGGVLVLANHVSYVDALILSLACPRPIRFLSLDTLFRVPLVGWVLRIFGAIPISSRHAKDALVKSVAHLKQGELLCLFPEGRLTITGDLMEIQRGFEWIATKAERPVVVAYMHGLWGSLFSFERGRFFWKWPRTLRLNVTVRFSPAMTPEEANVENVRARLLALKNEVTR